MLADGAAAVVLDRTGQLGDVAVEKFTEGPLADEADAGRIFFLGVGQADLVGNAPHLGLVQLTHWEQGLGQLRLAQAVQKVTLVFARIQALEQLMQAGGRIQAHAGVMAGGDLLGTQAHGMVQKGLEFDLGVAQDVGVGRAAGLVLTQELGKHAVLVVGREVDMLDLDADNIGHRRGIHKVDVGRAVLAAVVVFPVLHEDADHLMTGLLEQMGGDG